MRKTKRYQTPVYVLLALAVALLAGIPFMPQAAASPDQATFNSTLDGFVYAYNENYSIAHGSLTGTTVTDYPWLFLGQEIPAPPNTWFYVYRGALFFDTSSLPDDATISSAVLSLYGKYKYGPVNFLITVVDGSELDEPLQGTDYGYLGSQNVSGGAFNTSGFSTSGYNDIPLNGMGMGWISKTGITKLGLRSSHDIAADEPATNEYVWIYASEHPTEQHPPRLVVTYTVPVGGEAYPIDKTSVLGPWIGLALIAILATGAAVLALKRRRPA